MVMVALVSYCYVFFFNDTATTEIYTLSLHDALPIYSATASVRSSNGARGKAPSPLASPKVIVCLGELLDFIDDREQDRKSTRLNSSHANISYAVFCLKKKKKIIKHKMISSTDTVSI